MVKTVDMVEDWTTPERLETLRGWAVGGLTKEEIAKNIGISRTTIYEWMKKSPDFMNALHSGKDEADYRVVNALYKKALSGDTTAMIFWLKNRISKQWRDKQEIHNTFGEDFEISIGGNKENAED